MMASRGCNKMNTTKWNAGRSNYIWNRGREAARSTDEKNLLAYNHVVILIVETYLSN
jgi:hypothetical protein